MICPFEVGGQKSTIVYTPLDSFEAFTEIAAFNKLVKTFDLELV